MKDECYDCKYNDHGYCHRRSPVIGKDHHAVWPFVYSNDWCGDFEKREYKE